MSENEKKTTIKIIAIAATIIFLEYFLTASFGTFLKIILAIYALKYLKVENYFAIKIILIILTIPIIWGCYLALASNI